MLTTRYQRCDRRLPGRPSIIPVLGKNSSARRSTSKLSMSIQTRSPESLPDWMPMLQPFENSWGSKLYRVQAGSVGRFWPGRIRTMAKPRRRYTSADCRSERMRNPHVGGLSMSITSRLVLSPGLALSSNELGTIFSSRTGTTTQHPTSGRFTIAGGTINGVTRVVDSNRNEVEHGHREQPRQRRGTEGASHHRRWFPLSRIIWRKLLQVQWLHLLR